MRNVIFIITLLLVGFVAQAQYTTYVNKIGEVVSVFSGTLTDGQNVTSVVDFSRIDQTVDIEVQAFASLVSDTIDVDVVATRSLINSSDAFVTFYTQDTLGTGRKSTIKDTTNYSDYVKFSITAIDSAYVRVLLLPLKPKDQ